MEDAAGGEDETNQTLAIYDEQGNESSQHFDKTITSHDTPTNAAVRAGNKAPVTSWLWTVDSGELIFFVPSASKAQVHTDNTTYTDHKKGMVIDWKCNDPMAQQFNIMTIPTLDVRRAFDRSSANEITDANPPLDCYVCHYHLYRKSGSITV